MVAGRNVDVAIISLDIYNQRERFDSERAVHRLYRKEGEKKKEGEKRAPKKSPQNENRKKRARQKKKKRGQKEGVEKNYRSPPSFFFRKRGRI